MPHSLQANSLSNAPGSASLPRIGLALGGGAALGWAHIGALRALEKAGVKPDLIAGTSIGALVGAAWLCGALDPLEEIARAMSWRRLMAFADPQLGQAGLFRGEAIVRELLRQFGSRKIEEMDRPFVAVASDLIEGEEVHITSGPLERAVRASISVPGVFLPIVDGNRLLMDGGLINPVPVTAARALGADYVIAIDVTGDYHGRARAAGIGRPAAPPSPNPPPSERDWLKSIAGHFFARSPRRPGLYSVATISAALIMRKLAEANLRLSPADLLIVPAIGHISPLEFDRAEELIEAGRVAVETHSRELAKIKPVPAGNTPH